VQVTAWPGWAQHIRKIELEPDEELRVASKGRIYLRNGIRSEFRVVEFNPYSNWKWVGPFLWLTVHYDHRFDAEGPNASRLTWIIDAEGLGVSILGRLFAKVYRSSMEKAIPRFVAEMATANRGPSSTYKSGRKIQKN